MTINTCWPNPYSFPESILTERLQDKKKKVLWHKYKDVYLVFIDSFRIKDSLTYHNLFALDLTHWDVSNDSTVCLKNNPKTPGPGVWERKYLPSFSLMNWNQVDTEHEIYQNILSLLMEPLEESRFIVL
jgi:hypothetical protein